MPQQHFSTLYREYGGKASHSFERDNKWRLMVVLYSDCMYFLQGIIRQQASWSSKRSELVINLLRPTDYVMHQQFNIQQLCALPTLCLCVLYLSENKQRLVPLKA